VGWEYVHVCIDDHSRIAFAKIMPSEKKRSAIAFLKAALSYYESLGILVERVMTDNGLLQVLCLPQSLQAARAPAYPHQALYAKAERFIQTSLREWAYAYAY
jgi:hypothetical protein